MPLTSPGRKPVKAQALPRELWSKAPRLCHAEGRIIARMLRYLGPLILFAAAAWVWHYNTTHAGASVVLLPFLDLIPAFEADVTRRAEWSWKILAGIGGVIMLITIGVDLTRGRRGDATSE
jgi:hypothetical protein